MKKLLISLYMLVGLTGVLAAQSVSSQHDSYGKSKTTVKPKTQYRGTTTVNSTLRSNDKPSMTYQKIEWEKANKKTTTNSPAVANKTVKHTNSIQSSETDGLKSHSKTKQKN